MNRLGVPEIKLGVIEIQMFEKQCLTLNIQLSRGSNVLDRDHKRVCCMVTLVGILDQEFVDLFVDNHVDTGGGSDGLTVLQPASSFNVFLGELDFHLNDVSLTDRLVSKRLHQGHGAH